MPSLQDLNGGLFNNQWVNLGSSDVPQWVSPEESQRRQEQMAFFTRLANPNYVMTPQDFELHQARPYAGEDLAGLTSGIRTAVDQAKPSGEFNEMLGTLFGAGAMGGIALSGAMAGVGAEGAAAGAEGFGGFAPEAAFEGYGGTSVSGGLGGGYVPGVDASWGVNQAGFSPDAGFEQGVLPDSGGTSLSDLSRVPTPPGGAGSGNPDPGFEGYGGTPASQAGEQSALQRALQWARENPALVGLGGTLASSGIGALGSYLASNAQQESAANSLGLIERMYNQNRADLEPWRTAGVGALGNLTKLTTPGEQFDQAMLDPGYQFRLGEGSRAIDRAASARGRYYAPATMQALDRYNQNFATNEFGNVFNRNATLAGLGQVGTTAGVNAGTNYANNAANITQNAGEARASGYMGIANAVGGGIGQGVNYLNQQALLDALLRGRTS